MFDMVSKWDLGVQIYSKRDLRWKEESFEKFEDFLFFDKITVFKKVFQKGKCGKIHLKIEFIFEENNNQALNRS